MTHDPWPLQPTAVSPPLSAKAGHPHDLPPTEPQSQRALEAMDLPGGVVVMHQVFSADWQDHILSISQGCANLWELAPEEIVRQPELL